MRFACRLTAVIVVLLLGTVQQLKAQIGLRGSVQHQVGEEPGYEENYTRFGGFVPVWQDPCCRCLLYSDMQFTLDNESLTSGSFGLGGRVYLEDSDLILGLNSYWDRRDFNGGRGDHTFDQYGFGLELLGPVWAVRSNVYLNASGAVNNGEFLSSSFYQVNNLVLGISEIVDEAMQGGDLEIARTFASIPAEVGAGFYHLQAAGGNRNQAYGVMSRAQVWITNRLVGYAAVRNDRVFGTTTSGGFVWYFGGESTNPSARTLCERIAAPVGRQYHVPVASTVHSRGTKLALDPATGNPLTFTHVSAAAAAGGDGTYESPCNTLASASMSSMDIVLAQPGTYTGDSITMSANQRLLAASKLHTAATQRGTTALPQTGLGGTTQILNAPGNAITIVNNTEVSGFTITNPGADGIRGSAVTGYNINCNNVSGADFGVYINGNNSGDVTNNTFSGNNFGLALQLYNGGTVSGNTASGNTLDGLLFDTLSGGTVSQNTATGNSRHGFVVNNFSGGNTATFQNNISNNNTVRGYNITGTPQTGVGTNTGSGNGSFDSF